MCFTLATAIFTLAVLVVATPRPNLRNGGTAIPIIKRLSFLNTDNTVNVDALSSHVACVGSKILRGLENHERNTGVAHPSAVNKNRTRKRAKGFGVALKSHLSHENGYPVFWYTSVTIGSPPKPFSVQVDTGSSDFFVPINTCSTCLGHTLWNPTVDSTSVKPMREPFRANFADGSTVRGILYSDNVTIASFTADYQAIGAAIQYSYRFQSANFPPDGLIGLAFRSLSNSGQNPVFTTLVNEKKLPEDIFSVRLTPSGGELFVGGVNDDMYDGDITYNRVTHASHWQVKMQGIVGKDKEVMGELDVIIDTGSSFIGGNPSEVSELHKELGGQRLQRKDLPGEYYTYQCISFPRMSLIFDGRSFEISASNLGPVSIDSSDCISAIVGIDLGSTFWSVGGAFLQGVYTIFDFGNSRVGFADLKKQSG